MAALQVLQVLLAQHWARDWRALALTQVHRRKDKLSFLAPRPWMCVRLLTALQVLQVLSTGLGLSCPQPDPDHPARWVRFSAPRPWM